jgi:hypothetical protein
MSGNADIADLEEKYFLLGRHHLHAISNIEYGSVEVIIHDGKVVQIECLKKIRVGAP